MPRPQRALAEERAADKFRIRSNRGFRVSFERRRRRRRGGEGSGRHKFTPAAGTADDAVADLPLSSNRQASGEIVAVQRRPFHASHGDDGDERKGPT